MFYLNQVTFHAYSLLVTGVISLSHHDEVRNTRVERESSLGLSQLDNKIVLISYLNGSVSIGCDVESPHIIWIHNGEVVDFKHTKEDLNLDVLDMNRKISIENRLTSRYIGSSSRHILRIYPLQLSDHGDWSCHPTSEDDINEKVNPINMDKEFKLWKLYVMDGVEKIGVFKYTEIRGTSKDHSTLSSLRINLVHHKNRMNEIVTLMDNINAKQISGDTSSYNLNIDLDENEKLELMCAIIIRKQNIRDSLKEVLRWTTKTGHIVSESNILSRQTTSQHLVQGRNDIIGFITTLHINSVHKSLNDGDFTCSSFFGAISIRLKVKYTPNFVITRIPEFGVPVMDRMNVELGCKIDAPRQFHEVGWLKNGKKVRNGGKLIFDTIDMTKDTGWYQCELINVEHNESLKSAAYYMNIHTLTNDEKMEMSVDASPIRYLASKQDNRFAKHDISIRKATELDCSCCEHLLHRHIELREYMEPRLKSLNEATTNLIIDHDPILSKILAVKVCSNPKPKILLWATPKFTLRIGETSSDGTLHFNRTVIKDHEEADCFVNILYMNGNFASGDYILLAGNGYGSSHVLIHVERDLTGVSQPVMMSGSYRTITIESRIGTLFGLPYLTSWFLNLVFLQKVA